MKYNYKKKHVVELDSSEGRQRITESLFVKIYSHRLRTFLLIALKVRAVYRLSQERLIFWEVIVSVILINNCVCTCVVFRKVSEIEVFHCTIPKLLIRKRSVMTYACLAWEIATDTYLLKTQRLQK
jgi:hypothetical protein